MEDKEAIIVGSRLIKGKVHCANCGRYVSGCVFIGLVKGNKFIGSSKGDRFVCNVQCGIDFIAKNEKRGK